MGRLLPFAVVFVLLFAAPAFARHDPPEQTGRPAGGGCDALDPSVCMLPFPNDYFTVPDPTTKTGRRVDFDPLGMPRNTAGKPIVPTDWNRADGFSPGSLIVTKVPGLDTPEAFARTGAVPITDMKRANDGHAPVVVLDADPGRRALIWTELDMSVDQADRTLLIRPAKNLAEGHRYIVALRHMRRADGSEIPPPAAFKALRDGSPDADPGRAAHYEDLFATLKHAGIPRSSLY